MPSQSIRTIAFGAAMLALGAVVAPAAALADQTTPEQAAVDEAARQAQLAAGPRYVPFTPGGSYVGCVGEPPLDQRVAASTVDLPADVNTANGLRPGPYGGWMVSSPRGPLVAGQARISLQDKVGTASRMVYADVIAPDGTTARAGAVLFGARDAALNYPTDFRAAPPLMRGVYTVVWRSTIGDGFITCDGFVVE